MQICIIMGSGPIPYRMHWEVEIGKHSKPCQYPATCTVPQIYQQVFNRLVAMVCTTKWPEWDDPVFVGELRDLLAKTLDVPIDEVAGP